MTQKNIRAALESHLKLLTPKIPTVWESKEPPKSFDPAKPYAKAWLIPANNRTLGLSEKTTKHLGILQVSLCYPTGFGTAEIDAQIVAIQEHFKAGTVLEFGGITVRVRGKPDVAAPTSNSPITIPVSINYVSIFRG